MRLVEQMREIIFPASLAEPRQLRPHLPALVDLGVLALDKVTEEHRLDIVSVKRSGR